jgi:hypothetical protein
MEALMTGSEMCLARYYAKQAVKDEIKRQGLRPHLIAASELNRQAAAYLTNHPELIAFATEQYLSFVKSGRFNLRISKGKPSQ